MYSIINTQKGSKAILFQQNFYRLQKHNKNGTCRWVCTNRLCSCSITMNEKKIQAIRGIHSHDNVQRSLSVIQTVQEIRQEVQNDLNKPIPQIYYQMVADYVNKYLAFFPLKYIYI